MAHRSLLSICFYGYFAIGLVITVIGPLIPVLQESYSLRLAQVGTVFVAQGIGYAVAVLWGGALSDRIGRRPVLLVGTAAVSLAFLAFVAAGTWTVAILLFFVASLGAGTAESAINSLAVDLSGGDAGRVLNLLHFFPAAGAVAGPYLADLLLPAGWQAPFAAIGAMLGLFFFLTLLTPAKGLPQVPARRAEPAALTHPRLYSDPRLLLLSALLALYVGAEASITGWTYSYAVEALRATQRAGSIVTSLFWMGLMAGRIVCSRISPRIPAMTLTARMAAAAALTYVPVIGATSVVTLAATIFLSGVWIGGVFPTVVAYAARIFPERVGTATGFIIAVCAAGGAVIPAGVGAIADGMGLRAGLAANLLSLVGVALLALAAQGIHKASAAA